VQTAGVIGGAAVFCLTMLAAPVADAAKPCQFPGTARTCPAPEGGAIVAWRAAEARRRHALLVRTPGRAERVVLEFDRAAEVFWSPGGSAIAVTDHDASGESRVWVIWGRDFSQRTNLATLPAVADTLSTQRRDRRVMIVLEWTLQGYLRVALAKPLTNPPAHFARFLYEIGEEDLRPERTEGERMRAGVIGLLELREVLRDQERCRTDPVPVDVYRRTTDPAPSGSIHAQPALVRADGSCDGPEPEAGFAGGVTANFPTMEYDYEASGAIVVGQRPGWFEIVMPEGTGWVRATPTRTFHAVQELIRGLAHLSADWDGLFHTSPGGPARRPADTSADTIVDILRMDRRAGRDWVLVETGFSCDGPEAPRIRGWVPLYSDDRRPTIWFYSRGC
jgi:hypothetical protein